MCDILFGVITVSDRCTNGEAEDLSGARLKELIDDKFGVKEIEYDLVPDEIPRIEVCGIF